ncbi:MAG: hypothetical protein CMJ83_17110 [Planctomycetes bacterium]|nr:hypothetical protein [Planctomycetota bacterium]
MVPRPEFARLAGLMLVLLLGAAAAPGQNETSKTAKAARALAEKAKAEKDSADSELAKLTAAAKAAAARATSAEAAAASTIVERDAARKRLEEKTAAASGAAERAVAARGEVKKALAEQTAAAKNRAKKTAAATKAERTALAEEAAAAIAALAKAGTNEVAAKKALAKKAANARKTVIARKAAEAAEKDAANERISAARAKAATAAAEVASAKLLLKQRTAAVEVAIERATMARALAIGGLKPLARTAWSRDKARHLLDRAGFGGTPAEVDRLFAMGPYRAVNHLVGYHGRPSTDLAFDVSPPERPASFESRLVPAERARFARARQAQERRQQAKLRTWWLRRMVSSQRPLEEKLTLFWHGHFAVNYRTFYLTYILYQQNQLFRGRAGDNFGALLHGIVHDAAMLRYLDNNRNTKGHPNENLAREIMELFAMGEGKGYTEKDIREAARALTGYGYDPWSAHFRFSASRHDPGKKTIFRRTGNFAGDDLVDLILRQPATSRFIAKKLFAFFAFENPDPDVVETLARVLREHRYDLAPMLENMFLSEVFFSERAMGTQIKSPVQLMVGSIRTFGIENVDYAAVDRSLQGMGQHLFEPPNVKGWDGGRAWISAERILVRYNAVAQLVGASRGGGIDVVRMLEGRPFASAGEVVDHLARVALSTPLHESKRRELVASLGDLPPSSKWAARRREINRKLRALLVLLTSIPEYQIT